MPDFKFIMYNRFNKWGWSYDFFGSAVGEDPGLAAVLVTPDILNRWSAVHNNYTILEAIRVVNVNKPRLSLLIQQNPVRFGTGGATPAYPGFSVKVKINSSELGYHRYMSLRGLPQTWPAVDGPTGVPELPGVAVTAINNFIQSLITAGFGMRAAESQLTHPFIQIASLTESTLPAGWTKITTVAEHGFEPGDQVYIGSVPKCTFCNINGTWTVQAAGADNFTIRLPWPTGLTGPIALASGQVRPMEMLLRPFSTFSLHSVGTRDTGRPFALSRGRSSGASCRR